MAPTSDWDPDLYGRFEAMRSRPFWELAQLIEARSPIERMVDLGCGDGALTSALADRLRVASAVGVDSSSAMLERARTSIDGRQKTSGPHIEFRHGDLATWTDADVDLIVANASLQWVPDHADVLRRWCDALAPGGQFAVQVPSNADHPSHTCSIAVAHREPFLSAMGGAPPPDPVAQNVLRPEHYSALLHDLGIEDPTVRLVVYPQVMASSASVVEWVSGTSLTRFRRCLPDDLHQPFEQAYTEELLETIGNHRPYLYTFKRILMAGTKRG